MVVAALAVTTLLSPVPAVAQTRQQESAGPRQAQREEPAGLRPGRPGSLRPITRLNPSFAWAAYGERRMTLSVNVQRNDRAVAPMLLAAVDALNRYFCGEPYRLPDGTAKSR
ncbi:hypothetical protein [Nonomuraea jabiensis]|uniref:hypothetical protein n=1 Tax=Nonomuraea jabiensis TaxID=882448 RepID=UPI003D762E16